MPFQMPEELVKKELSPVSLKIYKSKLNKLASKGFDTVEKLKKESKAVLKEIEEIVGVENDEKTRYNKRVFLSAIFAVAEFPKKNVYHTYWNKSATPLKVSSGDKWMKKKDLDKQV